MRDEDHAPTNSGEATCRNIDRKNDPVSIGSPVIAKAGCISEILSRFRTPSSAPRSKKCLNDVTPAPIGTNE